MLLCLVDLLMLANMQQTEVGEIGREWKRCGRGEKTSVWECLDKSKSSKGQNNSHLTSDFKYYAVGFLFFLLEDIYCSMKKRYALCFSYFNTKVTLLSNIC